MADDLYGIGTKFYGKDNIRSDGSFTATKWIVIAYIPIVPLGSFYVRPTSSTLGTVSTSLPPITERMGWQKRHIVNVYAFIGAIAIAFLYTHHRINAPTTTAAIPARIGKGAALPRDRTNPDYVRPATAENGSPFPKTSGYIEGAEQLASQSLAMLTINNSSNTSDLYGKLYALESDMTTPVRTFFVAAEDSFAISNLDAGSYELRYQDLETGGLAKTEPLTLKRIEKEDGDYFESIGVTLSKVVNGNLETEPISDKDF